MAKKGVQLLPPVISEQQMIDIYKIPLLSHKKLSKNR